MHYEAQIEAWSTGWQQIHHPGRFEHATVADALAQIALARERYSKSYKYRVVEVTPPAERIERVVVHVTNDESEQA